MAVQAQCSSNILLLNRNIQQQGQNQFLLSPQPGGPTDGNGAGPPGCGATTFLDHQSINQTLFNNFPVGNYSTMNHQRKREREDNNMNHFMSNNMNQFMDVSNMQSRNNVDVSTGLRLAFNDHHHQQQQCFDPQSSSFTSLLSDDLSNLINQQGNDIDHFIHTQGEELRRKLAEKRQRHYNALIVAAKESSLRMIREKEVEADKAIRRNAELEAKASQLSAEAEIWQSKARAQEAVAAALQAQLQQAMGGCVSQGEEVGGDHENAEDAESSYIDPERVVVVSGPGCKACGKRVASVVLLPCRHLCVCSECDDLVQSCPLCLTFRSSSIQVYMS
nr:BOI-related E3 ubiquitin-protein ligase 1-like [Tanacetum cinerariifolium]